MTDPANKPTLPINPQQVPSAPNIPKPQTEKTAEIAATTFNQTPITPTTKSKQTNPEIKDFVNKIYKEKDKFQTDGAIKKTSFETNLKQSLKVKKYGLFVKTVRDALTETGYENFLNAIKNKYNDAQEELKEHIKIVLNNFTQELTEKEKEKEKVANKIKQENPNLFPEKPEPQSPIPATTPQLPTRARSKSISEPPEIPPLPGRPRRHSIAGLTEIEKSKLQASLQHEGILTMPDGSTFKVEFFQSEKAILTSKQEILPWELSAIKVLELAQNLKLFTADSIGNPITIDLIQKTIEGQQSPQKAEAQQQIEQTQKKIEEIILSPEISLPGFSNKGTECWRNSVLKAILSNQYYLPLIRESHTLQKMDDESIKKFQAREKFQKNLRKLYYEAQKNQINETNIETYLQEINQTIHQIDNTLLTTRQEDVGHFINTLFSALESTDETKCVLHNQTQLNDSNKIVINKEQTTPIHLISVQNKNLAYLSKQSEDVYYDQIKQKTYTIDEDGQKNYKADHKTESMPAANAKFNEYLDAKNKPQSIFIQLKLFDNKLNKITQDLPKIPEKLDLPLSQFKNEKYSKDIQYPMQLDSIIYHIGDNIQSGHYVALIKKGNKWQVHDDKNIQDYNTLTEAQDYFTEYKDSNSTPYILNYSIAKSKEQPEIKKKINPQPAPPNPTPPPNPPPHDPPPTIKPINPVKKPTTEPAPSPSPSPPTSMTHEIKACLENIPNYEKTRTYTGISPDYLAPTQGFKKIDEALQRLEEKEKKLNFSAIDKNALKKDVEELKAFIQMQKEDLTNQTKLWRRTEAAKSIAEKINNFINKNSPLSEILKDLIPKIEKKYSEKDPWIKPQNKIYLTKTLEKLEKAEEKLKALSKKNQETIQKQSQNILAKFTKNLGDNTDTRTRAIIKIEQDINTLIQQINFIEKKF